MFRRFARKALEEGHTISVWNANDFAMCGLGEKSRVLALAKHTLRCIRWSAQRVTRGYCDADVWDMYSYLQMLLPAMLQYLKDNRHGSPGYLGENCTSDGGFMVNDASHKEWDRILDRMIFLWQESSENTCSRKNPLETEYTNALETFTKEYGLFGEKLAADEEQGENSRRGTKRIHFMSELPEYRPVSDRYMEEEKKLAAYRERCKDEAMDLMKQHFFDLRD